MDDISLVNHIPCDEWCGDAFQLSAQQTLARERSWLLTQDGLLSQGRTLLILDRDISIYGEVLKLVQRFHRVLIYGDFHAIDILADILEEHCLEVYRSLKLLSGKADTVLSRIQTIEHGIPLPQGWTFSPIKTCSPFSHVRSVQQLQTSSGIAPLPGWFIRGQGLPTKTLVLSGMDEQIVGCATIQNVSSAWERTPRITMILCVCLDPALRGRGLSPRLNAAALRYGIEEFGAREIWEIVEDGNQASFSMNNRCGLRPHPTHTFLFVTKHLARSSKKSPS